MPLLDLSPLSPSLVALFDRASIFVTAESWAALRPLGPCVGGLIATMVFCLLIIGFGIWILKYH